MSFRELKLFSEIMKTLGYGRLISLDNFRRPNFELVADILYFFCDRIDSSIDLNDDISTKSKRVEFIKNCANILASKTQIKLKLKNLYKSDGYAVKELLKIAHFMNEANRQIECTQQQQIIQISSNHMTGMTDMNKLREYTHLGNKIVETGVELHNLLNHNENGGQIIDSRVIMFLDEMSHNIESYDENIKTKIDTNLNRLINEIDDNLNDLQQNKLIQLTQNIQILQTKVEEKQNEYERLSKRLASLRNIKPAFIEEYKILEDENTKIYNQYTEKFRNLSYLQDALGKYRIMEKQKEIKTKKRLKCVQKKLREQELKLLTNNHAYEVVDDLDVYDATAAAAARPNNATQSTTGSNSKSNTNSNSNTSSALSSTNNSSVTSPSRSMSTSNGSSASIGSISDINDEHLQF